MNTVHIATSDAILEVLRRHDIGAFNGTQVACAAPECRAWMDTETWRVHLADLIAERVGDLGSVA